MYLYLAVDSDEYTIDLS
nr:hypothetical protein [Peribacillus simplex]